MKRVYKYSFFTLLLLIMAAWLVHFLSPIYYSIAISSIRLEQLERIEKGDGIYISMDLPVSVVHTARDGNELQLGQNRYDIIAIHIKGDLAHCVLLYDGKETLLNKHLVRHVRNNRRSQEDTKRPISWWPAYFQQSSTTCLYNFMDNTITTCSSRSGNIILNGFLQNIIQPPDMV